MQLLLHSKTQNCMSRTFEGKKSTGLCEEPVRDEDKLYGKRYLYVAEPPVAFVLRKRFTKRLGGGAKCQFKKVH